jgi:CheY-like chemotaxis protein/glycine cleavage system H lipoate-binding protein
MEPKLNVMVVDDEQIVLDSAERHLRHDGYILHKALSAIEALKAFDEGTIDIVLTDLMMPDLDGLELLRAIKTKYPHVPVIIITGYATINTALQAMQLGAFDYVAKPFTKAELRGVVQRAANLVGGVEGGEDPPGKGDAKIEETAKVPLTLKGIGGHTWIMREESGVVLLGVERPFLQMLGRIQTVDVPAKGDVLRQGSVCLQIFTTDLRSHVVWSPISGTVTEVNDQLLAEPEKTLKDPYGGGWILRIEPANFEKDVEVLGL